MADDIRDFELEVRGVGAVLQSEIDAFARERMKTAAHLIVSITPVDLEDQYGHPGQARGAWKMGVNGFPAEGPEAWDKDGGATLRRLHQAIDAAPSGFSELVLANYTDYIVRLEQGHSRTQAPHGMVGITVAALTLGGDLT